MRLKNYFVKKQNGGDGKKKGGRAGLSRGGGRTVGNGGHEGEDQATAAAGLVVPGPVLHMLPQNAGILLMHTNRILHHHWLPYVSIHLRHNLYANATEN